MSPERAGLILCGFFVLLAIAGCIVQRDERKTKRLPPPSRDDRDWQGAFMKDFK